MAPQVALLKELTPGGRQQCSLMQVPPLGATSLPAQLRNVPSQVLGALCCLRWGEGHTRHHITPTSAPRVNIGHSPNASHSCLQGQFGDSIQNVLEIPWDRWLCGLGGHSFPFI